MIDMLHLPFFWLVLAGGLVHSVNADFEFTTSYPQECTTFNITWKPDLSAFPYSVYFMVMSAQVQSWRIDSNYQPNASEFTFQYTLPKIGTIFQNFMVSVVDSKGNGNSSTVLVPNSLKKHPSNCTEFSESNQWTYASDLVHPKGATEQDRLQCSVLNYYPVEKLTGSGPFSFSLVPELDTPITVNIPKSAQKNETYFHYESTLPYKQGTRFYQFMSDSLRSADGGGSPLYTVGPSQNDSCLQSGFKLQDLDTNHALPVGSLLASFQNLPGAIVSPSDDSKPEIVNNFVNGQNAQGDYNAKHLGSLLGGIIGSLFGLLLLALIMYKVHRIIQKKKQQSDRMENAQFVDLGESILEQGPASIRQSTLISPFFHDQHGAIHDEPLNDAGHNTIGLRTIAQNENTTALSTSFGDRSSTGLRRFPRSEMPRSGSDYGLSLANVPSDASEALLDTGHDSGNQSGSLHHERQQSRGSSVANESLQLRSGSMYSSTSNPFSINGVLAESVHSITETNTNMMQTFPRTSADPSQSSFGVIHDHCETRSRQPTSFAQTGHENIQTPESRHREHVDAGPVTEDSPPPYSTWHNRSSSSKT
jgi:hypothetical protein